MVTEETKNDWGRVDSDGTVYVRDTDGERAVGQFPDSTPEEALAYFVRKFDDLAGQVTLLEARINRGTATGNVTESVQHLREQLEEPHMVGDIRSLRDRVTVLEGKAAAFAEQQKAEREAAREQALAEREAIVTEAEQLAAQPESQIRWKDTGQAFETLFQRWQSSQRQSPQIPKSQADALWKRFRTARQSFDSARRQHFAQMDQKNKQVKATKERIITRAEALAPKGVEGIPEYRRLLDEWKAAGRANRKIDDALWARFKAAGDVLFAAKAEEQAITDAEYRENLSAKEALLDDAESILKETDHQQARQQLTKAQLAWDEIGRVPRDAVRRVEDRLRALEAHVKQLEDDHWAATNPETKARSEGLRGQLETSIAELEAKLANAGDEKTAAEIQSALATQRSWLAALD